MSKISIKLPPFSGVIAGSTAVANLAIGRRYHSLNLFYSGATLAQLNEIRVIANGEVIHRYSGDQRDTMNKFDSRDAAAGILIIPFDRYRLNTRVGKEMTALNTGSQDEKGRMISTLSVEVDIDGAAVAPVLSLRAVQSERLSGGPGVILRVKKRDISLIDGLEMENLAGGINGQNPAAQMLNKIYLGSANVTDALILRDNFTMFDRDKAENDFEQNNGERVPQAGYFVIDPTEAGDGGEPYQLEGYQDFRIRLAASGAANMTVITEFLGELGG